MARRLILRWVDDIYIFIVLSFFKNSSKEKIETAKRDITSRTERTYDGHLGLKKEDPEIFVGFEVSVNAGNFSLRVANPNRHSLPMYLKM